jgi:adenosine 3'-phospho 5'-phosphosulfate transporter B2
MESCRYAGFAAIQHTLSNLNWCFTGFFVPRSHPHILLQERIMQEPFDGERFKYSLLLVLCNRLVTVIVAGSLLIVNGQDIRPVAPPQAYAAVSVSNVVATFCQYEALKHVSFPLQTLGKCAKMIPVMVWGTIIMRKRYSKFDKLKISRVHFIYFSLVSI